MIDTKVHLIRRRDFLQSAALACGALTLPEFLFPQPATAEWRDVPGILARIRPPKFPNRDFNIAVSGGTVDCAEAIARAIGACSRAGGGRVVVPAGLFLTGAIHLRSNVNLHISEGATVRFSSDPQHYLPAVYTRWEGWSAWVIRLSSTLSARRDTGALCVYDPHLVWEKINEIPIRSQQH